MKTKIKAVLFALLTSVMIAVPSGIAVASDVEGKYTVFGHGLASCAKYLKEDKEDNWTVLAYNAWVSGFMSATGGHSNTQKLLGDVADWYGIQYLIRQYCEKNPLDNLADAAEDVAEQLIDRAGRL